MPDTVMMQPETTDRPSLKNLAAALAKAQAEMEGAKKGANNPHFNRKYADLHSVWEAIREPLSKNGLSVVQLLRSMQGGVEVETILLHTSGEQIGAVFAIPANKGDAQGYGSAATYARRYSLMAMVGVAPEEDDGNAATQGTPGSAGGGSEFRPAVSTHRNGVRQASASGARMAAEEPELVANAQGRMKGTNLPSGNGNGKKTAAEKAKEWTDNAIQTLNLSGQTAESLSKFYKDNTDKIEWLEGNAADQHERFMIAYDNAQDAVKGKVAA